MRVELGEELVVLLWREGKRLKKGERFLVREKFKGGGDEFFRGWWGWVWVGEEGKEVMRRREEGVEMRGWKVRCRGKNNR